MVGSNRILLTGANGQVGWELKRSLAALGEVIATDRTQLDLSDTGQIRTIIRETRPGLIVNAAAYTAVDKAEDEPELAQDINSTAPAVMAQEATKIGAAMVHYSTDFVYDGSGDRPWKETDSTGPLNVYGRTKLEGDRAIQESGVPHIIFRTSWVYGVHGHNFVKTMLKLGAERRELSIVNDQVGAPTSAEMIADTTQQVLSQAKDDLNSFLSSKGGVVHLCCQGETSWHGFAQEIFRQARERRMSLMVEKVKGIPSSEYPARATRPLNSRLDCTRLRELFALEPPSWKIALDQFMASL